MTSLLGQASPTGDPSRSFGLTPGHCGQALWMTRYAWEPALWTTRPDGPDTATAGHSHGTTQTRRGTATTRHSHDAAQPRHGADRARHSHGAAQTRRGTATARCRHGAAQPWHDPNTTWHSHGAAQSQRGSDTARRCQGRGDRDKARRDRMWPRIALPGHVIARSPIIMRGKREGPLNLRHSSFVVRHFSVVPHQSFLIRRAHSAARRSRSML